MKYLYSWIKEHYPTLPLVDELSDLLNQLGHTVERMNVISYDGLIVAEIQEVSKHPNADKLSLVTITTGEQNHSVVCGAPNLKAGQKVVYASVGTILPCGITLKKTAIRGIESDGMLCAEDELGIGSDHSGLLALPAEAKVGDHAATYLPTEAIFDLEIVPSRGDVLSHFGLARDIQAAKDATVLTPNLKTVTNPDSSNTKITIDSIHPDARALSLGLVESNGKMPMTPLLMQSRLNLLGQKCINLATDITNYLLLEYGQPLHAYDADKLPQPTVYNVRRARNGEVFHGLNAKSYTLTPQSLVIAISDKPVALAGVLGGEETKVTSNTTRVIFESAAFYRKPIRLMARGLNCLTDSAVRWERGVDYTLMSKILTHAQSLYCELADATAFNAIVKENPTTETSSSTTLHYDEIVKVIGTPMQRGPIKTILLSLGCTVITEDDKQITIMPPTWRLDLTIPEDYYEEIVRITGIDTLTKIPLSASVPQWKRSKYWREESLKDILVALGASEIMTYPFMSENEIKLFTPDKPTIELVQAPIAAKNIMRTTLVPGMLDAIATNPEVPSFTMFEINKIFEPKQELEYICIATAGNTQAEIDAWWQNLFERLRFPVSSWMSRVKTISDDIKNEYKIRKSIVCVLHLPVSEMLQGKQYENPTVVIPDLDEISYTQLSKFQVSRRDISLAFDNSNQFEYSELIEAVTKLDPTIVEVSLFDTYTPESLAKENKRSAAFSIYYQASDHTLTTEEIQHLHAKVEDYIKEHYHGAIR